MKIIASKCEIATLNSIDPNIKTTSWAVSVCAKLLEENGINAEEIGIVLGNSISVSGTTEDSNSAAPSICHTVQKDLKILNAFVFDLFHSDWCTAIEVASIFLSKQTQKYGLIIKGENFQSFESNSYLSFPTAISVIVIENEDLLKEPVQHYFIENEQLQNATLSYVPNENIENPTIKFQIKWHSSLDIAKVIKDKFEQVIEDIKQKSSSKILIEQWFIQENFYNTSESIINAGNNIFGMHSIPWELEKIKNNSLNLNLKLQLLAFNPFLSQFTSLPVNI